MEAILAKLGQSWRVKKLQERFNALPASERSKPAVVYDIWEEPELGTVALFQYTALDANDKLTPGNELCYSKDSDAVRKAVKALEDSIWIPLNLIASREQQERKDREDGIIREQEE